MLYCFSFTWQDNAKLREELERLKAAKAATSPSKPKPVAKPKPVPKRASKAKEAELEPHDEADPQDEETEEDEEAKDLSEAAKKQRLRRVCQRKPSGKLSVPESVHDMWKQGGHAREELQELLEESGWDKDQTYLSERLPTFSARKSLSRRSCGPR